MRVVSDRPLDILKSVVKEHLASVWAQPQLLALLFDPKAAPVRVEQWFTDQQMTDAVAEDTLQKRLVCTSNNPGQAPVVLVASLALELPGIVALLSDTMEPLVAVQTESADNADGTLQLYGAEPGVLLLTLDQLRAQAGRKLLRGTSLHNFRLEMRQPSGSWAEHNAGFSIPLDGIRSITPD